MQGTKSIISASRTPPKRESSFDTLKKEIKLVVMEKHGFENLESVWKHVKIQAIEAFEPTTSGPPNRGYASHFYNTSHQRFCSAIDKVCASWEVSGNGKNSKY